jgi:hypothetical protein
LGLECGGSDAGDPQLRRQFDESDESDENVGHDESRQNGTYDEVSS